MEYIATIQNQDSNEILPFFVDKIHHQNTYKIIYKQKQNATFIWKSYKLENGIKKDWDVNLGNQFADAYLSLSRNGSFLSNGEYIDLIETSDNHFVIIQDKPNEFLHIDYIKNGDDIFGIKPNNENSKLDGSYSGYFLRSPDLLLGFDNKLSFSIGKRIDNAMWNYCITEYNGSDLLYIYSQENYLCASTLDARHKKTFIDHINCTPTYKKSGCDYGPIEEGYQIKTIGRENPFIIIGGPTYDIFRFKGNKLQTEALKIKSVLDANPNSLFSYHEQLFKIKAGQLQKLEAGSFINVKLPDVIILGICGSEEGIFLAVRKMGDVNNHYFDLCKLNF